MPQYIIRAKVGAGWICCGAAWPLRSGEDGFSLKITSVPIGFDGRLVLLPPLENDEAAEPPAEELPADPPRQNGRRRKETEETPL